MHPIIGRFVRGIHAHKSADAGIRAPDSPAAFGKAMEATAAPAKTLRQAPGIDISYRGTAFLYRWCRSERAVGSRGGVEQLSRTGSGAERKPRPAARLLMSLGHPGARRSLAPHLGHCRLGRVGFGEQLERVELIQRHRRQRQVSVTFCFGIALDLAADAGELPDQPADLPVLRRELGGVA